MIHLFIIMIAVRGWASPPEAAFSQALTRARSAQQVERLRLAYSRLKIAQTACQIELSERTVPVNCYEAIALEMPEKSSLKVSRLARLDLLCARAANALRLSEPNAYVTKACARDLSQAREIQRYRNEEDSAWSSY